MARPDGYAVYITWRDHTVRREKGTASDEDAEGDEELVLVSRAVRTVG